MTVHDYTQPCGCYSSYDTETDEKTNKPCEKHETARKNMKPYTTYTRLGRGLCPQCHGHDEVINMGACVCDVWDEIGDVGLQINTIKELKKKIKGKEIDAELRRYMDIKESLQDDIDRVRRRKGHES